MAVSFQIFLGPKQHNFRSQCEHWAQTNDNKVQQQSVSKNNLPKPYLVPVSLPEPPVTPPTPRSIM
jgi:hypothetical protein